MLTIVMYHYVRDLSHSRYPAIKGRTLEAFDAQLDHIAARYTVCAMRDVVAAARGARALPANACLLTFDDGFADHFTAVFPRLIARRFTGAFFPPVAAVDGHRVLDTHKVHFILATVRDTAKLAHQVLDMVDGMRGDHDLPPREALYGQLAHGSRFDPPEVIFVKRALQRALPEPVRAAIAAQLFADHVDVPEAVFARELYMDRAQLRCMISQGMEVGGHGAEHVWLDALSAGEQRSEIEGTRRFLDDLHGAPVTDWAMCYPFGSYDATTLALLRAAGCALGLTTRVAVADSLAQPLELPRLDTNDLPAGAA